VSFVVHGFVVLCAFTKSLSASRIEGSANIPIYPAHQNKKEEKRNLMAVVTGELIRAMNYVEDITATLRRICIYIPGMSSEERKRLAESLRGTVTAVNAAIADLEKVEK